MQSQRSPRATTAAPLNADRHKSPSPNGTVLPPISPRQSFDADINGNSRISPLKDGGDSRISPLKNGGEHDMQSPGSGFDLQNGDAGILSPHVPPIDINKINGHESK